MSNQLYPDQWLQKPSSFLQPRLQNPFSFLQPLVQKAAADFHIGCRIHIGCRKTAYHTYRFVHNSRSIAGQSNISHINEKSKIIPGANKNTNPSHGFISSVILTFKKQNNTDGYDLNYSNISDIFCKKRKIKNTINEK